MAASPNPRLQRTRSAPLRSPLSRKPFGDRKNQSGFGRLGPALVAAGTLLLAACTHSQVRYVPKPPAKEEYGVRLHEDGGTLSALTAVRSSLELRGGGPDVVGRTGSSQAVFAG